MKFLLIAAPIVIGLLAAALTVVLGGYLFPKAHTATRSLRLAAAPEQVWMVLTDFPSQPSWRPGLKSMEKLPDQDGRPVWKEVDKHGQAMSLQIMEFLPPSRLVTRIADPSLPFGGTWTWEITRDSGPAPACRVRITEHGEVYNPAFRYISRIIGHTMTMDAYLKALAIKFNQPPTLEP